MRGMILLVGLLWIAGSDAMLRAEEASYLGIAKCASSGCHGSVKLGNQKGPWDESPHSKAVTNLDGKKGKEYAAKLKVENPAESELCLSCHSTALGVADERLTETFDASEGVQCEACHGAGSAYLEPHKKKERVYENLLTLGLRPLKDVQQQKNNCAKCHGPDERYDKLKGSGHAEPNKMAFDEGMKKIKHWKDKPPGSVQ